MGVLWYVCQTKGREETRAGFFLKKKGFEVYLPMMEAHRCVGPRQVLVPKPLFPSYIFVRFDREIHIPQVRWTQGVVKILPESADPRYVDDGVIACLQSLARRDGLIRKQSLRRFDRVRILRGPFKDLLGIFEEWSSDTGRVRILLEFIGYQARVEMHHSLVERVA